MHPRVAPDSHPLIAITMGDPAGIGPELCLRACESESVRVGARPLILGDRSVLKQVASRLGWALPPHTMALADLEAEAASPDRLRSRLAAEPTPLLIDFGLIDKPIEPGQPTALGGEASYRYFTTAIDWALGGVVDAVTTAPITKTTFQMAGIPEPGHTEILAHRTATADYAMMLYSPRLAVTLVTIHQSLASVPGALRTEEIVRITRLADQTLMRIRGQRPRLAILGLNPHAGEGGLFGREEIEVIGPAIEQLKSEGLHVEGPIPPDAAFMPAAVEHYDGHICMYHDQGLIPFKMVSLHDGVNLTLGLPIVRTSPDHGTAYNIAWQGRADDSSMIAAIELAARLAH